MAAPASSATISGLDQPRRYGNTGAVRPAWAVSLSPRSGVRARHPPTRTPGTNSWPYAAIRLLTSGAAVVVTRDGALASNRERAPNTGPHSSETKLLTATHVHGV